MTTLNLNNKTCVPTLKLLGDFWTLRIVDALSEGGMHYCELQRSVGGVNPVTLTSKLKKLEQADIVKRKEESRTDVTYCLTGLGKKVVPILAAVNDFALAVKR